MQYHYAFLNGFRSGFERILNAFWTGFERVRVSMATGTPLNGTKYWVFCTLVRVWTGRIWFRTGSNALERALCTQGPPFLKNYPKNSENLVKSKFGEVASPKFFQSLKQPVDASFKRMFTHNNGCCSKEWVLRTNIRKSKKTLSKGILRLVESVLGRLPAIHQAIPTICFPSNIPARGSSELLTNQHPIPTAYHWKSEAHQVGFRWWACHGLLSSAAASVALCEGRSEQDKPLVQQTCGWKYKPNQSKDFWELRRFQCEG